MSACKLSLVSEGFVDWIRELFDKDSTAKEFSVDPKKILGQLHASAISAVKRKCGDRVVVKNSVVKNPNTSPPEVTLKPGQYEITVYNVNPNDRGSDGTSLLSTYGDARKALLVYLKVFAGETFARHVDLHNTKSSDIKDKKGRTHYGYVVNYSITDSGASIELDDKVDDGEEDKKEDKKEGKKKSSSSSEKPDSRRKNSKKKKEEKELEDDGEKEEEEKPKKPEEKPTEPKPKTATAKGLDGTKRTLKLPGDQPKKKLNAIEKLRKYVSSKSDFKRMFKGKYAEATYHSILNMIRAAAGYSVKNGDDVEVRDPSGSLLKEETDVKEPIRAVFDKWNQMKFPKKPEEFKAEEFYNDIKDAIDKIDSGKTDEAPSEEPAPHEEPVHEEPPPRKKPDEEPAHRAAADSPGREGIDGPADSSGEEPPVNPPKKPEGEKPEAKPQENPPTEPPEEPEENPPEEQEEEKPEKHSELDDSRKYLEEIDHIIKNSKYIPAEWKNGFDSKKDFLALLKKYKNDEKTLALRFINDVTIPYVVENSNSDIDLDKLRGKANLEHTWQDKIKDSLSQVLTYYLDLAKKNNILKVEDITGEVEIEDYTYGLAFSKNTDTKSKALKELESLFKKIVDNAKAGGNKPKVNKEKPEVKPKEPPAKPEENPPKEPEGEKPAEPPAEPAGEKPESKPQKNPLEKKPASKKEDNAYYNAKMLASKNELLKFEKYCTAEGTTPGNVVYEQILLPRCSAQIKPTFKDRQIWNAVKSYKFSDFMYELLKRMVSYRFLPADYFENVKSYSYVELPQQASTKEDFVKIIDKIFEDAFSNVKNIKFKTNKDVVSLLESSGLFLKLPYNVKAKDDKVEKTEQFIANCVGRRIVCIELNNTRIPFYESTGSGKKAGVPSGKWYPFFGISEEDGWFNKGSADEEIANYYGVKELKFVAQWLDDVIGDVIPLGSDKDVPRFDDQKMDQKEFLDFINRDMEPTPNGRFNSNKFKAFIESLSKKLKGADLSKFKKFKEQLKTKPQRKKKAQPVTEFNQTISQLKGGSSDMVSKAIRKHEKEDNENINILKESKESFMINKTDNINCEVLVSSIMEGNKKLANAMLRKIIKEKVMKKLDDEKPAEDAKK